jgi:hypothetical protein
MAEKTGRRVHISFSGHETKITLAWFQDRDEGGRGFQIVDLHYPKSQVLESVNKALDILVPNWCRIFAGEYNHSIISCELDKDPTLFDAITSAEEPEQYFISRETLNYCGGRSASLRLWDIEFVEKYPGLIAFNQQAQAQA